MLFGIIRNDIKNIQELVQDVASYIDKHYVGAYELETFHEEKSQRVARREPSVRSKEMRCPSAAMSLPDDLDEFLRQKDAGFAVTLVDLIQQSGKTNSEIYKKAKVDKKLFSKIINNVNYHPSKQTAVAFAIALELDLKQTQDLIGKAGYTLTHSSKFDLIIEFFIKKKHYNIFEINEVLFAFDQVLLGC